MRRCLDRIPASEICRVQEVLPTPLEIPPYVCRPLPESLAQNTCTIGAGDAFCAALVLALQRGLDYTSALSAANLVGADAVGDPSSQPDLARLGYYLERIAPAVDAR